MFFSLLFLRMDYLTTCKKITEKKKSKLLKSYPIHSKHYKLSQILPVSLQTIVIKELLPWGYLLVFQCRIWLSLGKLLATPRARLHVSVVSLLYRFALPFSTFSTFYFLFERTSRNSICIKISALYRTNTFCAIFIK